MGGTELNGMGPVVWSGGTTDRSSRLMGGTSGLRSIGIGIGNRDDVMTCTLSRLPKVPKVCTYLSWKLRSNGTEKQTTGKERSVRRVGRIVPPVGRNNLMEQTGGQKLKIERLGEVRKVRKVCKVQ